MGSSTESEKDLLIVKFCYLVNIQVRVSTGYNFDHDNIFDKGWDKHFTLVLITNTCLAQILVTRGSHACRAI